MKQWTKRWKDGFLTSSGASVVGIALWVALFAYLSTRHLPPLM